MRKREFDLPVHIAFPSTTDGGHGGAGADAGDDAEVGDGCVGHNDDGCLSHGATIISTDSQFTTLTMFAFQVRPFLSESYFIM